ncbi:MAG: HAD-IIB family hydrolase [Chloroflexota bacterium]|nr:MAG: HAD-IIB family hydrolase [Chloroflexota bacterium]
MHGGNLEDIISSEDESHNKPIIRLFSSDIDGTLLDQINGSTRFGTIWKRLSLEERPILCYNTGRMTADVRKLVRDGQLPEPDFIISGVGTSIFDFNSGTVLKEFTEILADSWDADLVEQVITSLPYTIDRQPAHFQDYFKSSWFFDAASPVKIQELEKKLESAGLDVHVVYSSARHLDVLPKWANKGNALRWLLRHLDIPVSQTLVAGDSGNDSAMFSIPQIHGIVVGNAQPELLQKTSQLPIYHASPDNFGVQAVLHGLVHYGVIQPDMISQQDGFEQDLLYESILYSADEEIQGLTRTQVEFIRLGYENAIEALHRTITPMGFAASSLEDNVITGTDENYRSVWARDGAITIIGSLDLIYQDDAIHNCQRNTLETILDHVSPTGQVPANVRIDSSQPDYSGVGGIASIDSGLWIMIAFYAYIQRTQDLDLLREHFAALQRVMDWLSAHDSNNDSLLEIPEAGDWTDLFGRSYNVLYDEVLWYQANICFGRMLQMLGDEERAGDYFRWARSIKRKIRHNFWPSTQEHIYHAESFAERQITLGDARYLIAQTTPFDFSWRCDTFANVLAYLYDVIDGNWASRAFRFMWGVGVNEPFPIANLYPVVMSADNDWREYYTINLLNLPHHYHNGGIWPFIGAHWVRFIDKLGLRELALQELYRLAEMNKLGVLNEWEFNEWFHGETGRPMGKAYQAWSAAQYILSCHALDIIP